MSVVDAIIKANQEGRKVEWPTGPDTEALKDCIANLLKIIDDMSPESLHLQGQTPDWYVYAAYLSAFGKKHKAFDEFPQEEKPSYNTVSFATLEIVDENKVRCLKCGNLEYKGRLDFYGCCTACQDDML